VKCKCGVEMMRIMDVSWCPECGRLAYGGYDMELVWLDPRLAKMRDGAWSK
jgi:hypothetical protein